MGLLRFLLAISVVFMHIGITFGYISLSGTLAIYSFYIISGFYMALILNEKYIGKNGTYKLFLTNRFLRIYPLYWVVLALSLFFYLIFFAKLQFVNPLAPFIIQYQLLHGLGLYTQFIVDSIRVIFLIPNSVYFLPFKINLDPLVVGQSWTLGLELMFYMIVPFIAKRSFKQILFLVTVCFFIREITYHFFPVIVGNNVYFNTSFFPSVCFFFILGVLSYKLYAYIKNINLPAVLPKIIIIYVAAYTIFYNYVPANTQNIYLFSIFIFIPVIFKQFSKNKFDKFLGDLSYPIYISHMLLINIFIFFLPRLNKNFSNVILFIVCLLFGLVLHYVVEVPIDKYRQSRLMIKVNKRKL